MGTFLNKLIEVSSPALGRSLATLPEEITTQAGALGAELAELYQQRNGFFAFLSALHVFPIGFTYYNYNVEKWNNPELWRNDYEGMADEYLFFAQDVFGEQFGLKSGYVWRFNPETGAGEALAESLEEWAQLILEDYNYQVGYEFAQQWQEAGKRLLADTRLLPKIPFVAGGEYVLSNFYAGNMVQGMKTRASFACQIRDLPDGAAIQIKVVE